MNSLPASPTSPQWSHDTEAARLEALRSLELLDSPGEDGFDILAELLAQILQVPVVLIALVDRERVWCASHHGTDLDEYERQPGLVDDVLHAEGPHIVQQAQADPRTYDHPLVTGSFGLRFQAAVALRLRDRTAVGILSAIDFAPRTLSAEQLRALELLGRVVSDRMELRRSARRAHALQRQLRDIQAQLGQTGAHDALTGSWNLAAVMVLLGQAHARSLRDGRALAVMLLEIDSLAALERQFGSAVTDQILLAVSVRLQDTLRGGDAIGRVGGDRFMCLLESFAIDSARMVAERCRGAVARLPVPFAHGDLPGQTMVSVSVGLILVHPSAEVPPEALVERAETLLDQSRTEGGNRVTFEVLGLPN